MKVRELMSRPVQTCRSNEPLSAAAQKMWDADIGAVAVVDDKDRVVGMVTDRDLCMAAYTQGRPLHEIVLAQTMSSHLVSCGPEDSLGDALTLMKKHQIRRLPVLDGERHVVGIISLSDLIRWPERPSSRGEADVIDTVAAVSQPRRSVALVSAA
jgi:CBS domain-containing protein